MDLQDSTIIKREKFQPVFSYNQSYFFKACFLPTSPRIIMRKTVRRRPRTTVKVNFSWSGSLLDVWYLANKSSPNLIRTGTEVSLGGEPESLATATTCVSVVLRWSRSSRVKSPWSLTLKKFKWCVQVNIKNRKSNRQKIKKVQGEKTHEIK